MKKRRGREERSRLWLCLFERMKKTVARVLVCSVLQQVNRLKGKRLIGGQSQLVHEEEGWCSRRKIGTLLCCVVYCAFGY